MSTSPRIGIIGARGFAGGELLRLCLLHPDLQVTYVTSESQAGVAADAAFPGLVNASSLHFESFQLEAALDRCDAYFFALPDGEAMAAVGPLLDAGKTIVDVSGDFRVRDSECYQKWYGRTHLAPELLAEAVYGLPEIGSPVQGASLVANPGCYPTAILLAVAPLFSDRLAVPGSLIANAASGVSGAGGRSALDPAFSFAAIENNFRAYAVTGHRHIAEMEQELSRLAGDRETLVFTPHLLPLMRGILATCYVRLNRDAGADELVERYDDYYRGAPFVKVHTTGLPELRHVAGSNFCHLGLRVDHRTQTVIVVSALDNLVKGAAGSALQNMNLALGLPETAGLLHSAFGP